MSANSKRPENEETAGSDSDFESGLDYGAFAEDAPDFPEDRLEGTDQDGPAQQASGDAAAPSPGEGDTTAVSRPGQDATRPLDDVAAAEPAPEPVPEPADSDTSATAALPRTGTPEGTGSPQSASSPESISAAAEAPAAVPAPGTASPATSPAAGSPAPAGSTEPYRPYEATATTAVPRHESGEAITDADLDEEVARDKRGVSRFFQVLVAIFVPLMITVAAIRFVASPVFLWIAYNRPGFPEDTGAFDVTDRLLYGSYGMDYLFNAANSRYLAELAPGGEPLFTESEVSHMTDVKLVMVSAMGGGLVLLLLTLIFAMLLRRWRPGGVARGFFAGAWATLGLIAAAAVVAILSWQQFFDTFHRIFFADGTWTFSPDSTLIRLYPEQFWMDAGIAVVGLVALIALITLIITWPTKRRRARRQARLEEVYAIRREKLVAELTKDAEYSNAPKAGRRG
ncbi:TIGR01906 family membrane protein [Nesterenkonia sp. K-15-9-6]|uniref:TIGR01906 family membrane protein n=1 Tax=Nesterenkonia sp. K-15-9-6 TaxID=3093918 RepID=UPI0040444BE1